MNKDEKKGKWKYVSEVEEYMQKMSPSRSGRYFYEGPCPGRPNVPLHLSS